MTTVKLYYIHQYEAYRMDETGRHYSLEPYGKNTQYYKGEDDGGRDYELPEGYSVGETKYGELAIFDEKDEHVELCTLNNRPVLITGNGTRWFLRSC